MRHLAQLIHSCISGYSGLMACCGSRSALCSQFAVNDGMLVSIHDVQSYIIRFASPAVVNSLRVELPLLASASVLPADSACAIERTLWLSCCRNVGVTGQTIAKESRKASSALADPMVVGIRLLVHTYPKTPIRLRMNRLCSSVCICAERPSAALGGGWRG